MKEIQLARRYALAVFAVAREMELTARVAADFEQIERVIAENRDFRLMLNSPVFPVHKKCAILKALFSNHIHEISLRFMDLLTRHGREKYLVEVAEQIGALFREFTGCIVIRIISAHPLSTANRSELITLLKKTFGENIETREIIDSNLIGGFVLEWGDQRYDSSLIREVKELRKEFGENLYIRQF